MFLQPYGCTTRLYEYRVPITHQFLNLAQTALRQFNIFKRLGQYALLDRGIGFGNFRINRAADKL